MPGPVVDVSKNKQGGLPAIDVSNGKKDSKQDGLPAFDVSNGNIANVGGALKGRQPVENQETGKIATLKGEWLNGDFESNSADPQAPSSLDRQGQRSQPAKSTTGDGVSKIYESMVFNRPGRSAPFIERSNGQGSVNRPSPLLPQGLTGARTAPIARSEGQGAVRPSAQSVPERLFNVSYNRSATFPPGRAMEPQQQYWAAQSTGSSPQEHSAYATQLLDYAKANSQRLDSQRYALDLADLAGMYNRNGVLAVAAVVTSTGGLGGPSAVAQTAGLVERMTPIYILGFGASLARGPNIDGRDLDRQRLGADYSRLIDSVPSLLSVLSALSANPGTRVADFAGGVLIGGSLLEEMNDPETLADQTGEENARLVALSLLLCRQSWRHSYLRSMRRRRKSSFGTGAVHAVLGEDEKEESAGFVEP
jgi:hypothetical protein